MTVDELAGRGAFVVSSVELAGLVKRVLGSGLIFDDDGADSLVNPDSISGCRNPLPPTLLGASTTREAAINEA